jgi:hypothetical protein
MILKKISELSDVKMESNLYMVSSFSDGQFKIPDEDLKMYEAFGRLFEKNGNNEEQEEIN